jgi:hypothetical protein
MYTVCGLISCIATARHEAVAATVSAFGFGNDENPHTPCAPKKQHIRPDTPKLRFNNFGTACLHRETVLGERDLFFATVAVLHCQVTGITGKTVTSYELQVTSRQKTLNS